MSREIDLSNPGALSDDEKLYLAQRGQLPESVMSVEEQRQLLDLSNDVPLSQRANTGDANTANLTIEQLEAELAKRRAEMEATNPADLMDVNSDQAPGDTDTPVTAAADDDEDDEEEGLEAPYDQHTVDQLRAEIARRNEGRDEDDRISLDGRKPDLVAALEADDEDDEE